MAQPIDNETICPNTSKGQKQFFINNYSPKRCGLFFWTQPEVQVGGPWVCLDTLQCPEHRRGGRRGQPPAPHSLFPPRPPPSPSPWPFTWSLSYRAWSGLRPAFPCQVDLITLSSAAGKRGRKIRGVGRGCFPHPLWRCPSWDATSSLEKRQIFCLWEKMLKQCSPLPLIF